MVKLAQSTADIDWKNIELRVYGTGDSTVTGVFALPGGDLQKIELQRTNNSYTLSHDFSNGKIKWSITRANIPSR